MGLQDAIRRAKHLKVSGVECFCSLWPENFSLGEEGLLREPLVSSATLPPVPLIYYPIQAIVREGRDDLWARGGTRSRETSSFPASPGSRVARPRTECQRAHH